MAASAPAFFFLISFGWMLKDILLWFMLLLAEL